MKRSSTVFLLFRVDGGDGFCLYFSLSHQNFLFMIGMVQYSIFMAFEKKYNTVKQTNLVPQCAQGNKRPWTETRVSGWSGGTAPNDIWFLRSLEWYVSYFTSLEKEQLLEKKIFC